MAILDRFDIVDDMCFKNLNLNFPPQKTKTRQNQSNKNRFFFFFTKNNLLRSIWLSCFLSLPVIQGW